MSRRRYLRGSELAAGKITLRDLETIQWRRALRHLRLHLAAGDQLEHEGQAPADLELRPHLGRLGPLVPCNYRNGPRLLEGKSGPGRNLASVLVLLRVLVDRN